MTADLQPTPASTSLPADDAPPLPLMVVQRVEDAVASPFAAHKELPCARCGHLCALGEGAFRQVHAKAAIPTCRQCADAAYR